MKINTAVSAFSDTAVFCAKGLQGKVLVIVFCKIHLDWPGRNSPEGVIGKFPAVLGFLTNAFFPADDRFRLRRRGVLAIGAAGLNFFSEQHRKTSSSERMA